MNGFVQHNTPVVTYAPTLSGGMGAQALRRFYEHHFIGRLPPSMRLRLLSRTTGSDRVVDELYVSFEHTQEIPWMLPGVPPTNRRVEIVLVSIVSLRAGRLYSEHTYWDQASVLLQVGLLDPKLLPPTAQGIDRLPVVGREAARRVLHEDPEVEQEDYHNRLLRRAHARARKGHSSRSEPVEESGTEVKSEAGQPKALNKETQSKSRQGTQSENGKHTDITSASHEPTHDGDDVAEDFESPQKSTEDATDRAAYVEDAGEESQA